MVAAAPGAFTAAFILQYLSELAVKAVLYTLMFGSSVLALYRVIKNWTPAPAPEPAVELELKEHQQAGPPSVPGAAAAAELFDGGGEEPVKGSGTTVEEVAPVLEPAPEAAVRAAPSSLDSARLECRSLGGNICWRGAGAAGHTSHWLPQGCHVLNRSSHTP